MTASAVQHSIADLITRLDPKRVFNLWVDEKAMNRREEFANKEKEEGLDTKEKR